MSPVIMVFAVLFGMFLMFLAQRIQRSDVAQGDDIKPTDLIDAPLAEGSALTPMTGERLKGVIKKLDELAVFNGNSANFSMNALDLIVVYDEAANRMRIMAPIAKVEGIPQAVLMRMLQANYNRVLDARYAVAEGHIWALFLHPLSTLTEEDFISAAAQTAAAADNFGHSYSSGRVMFRGGDHE